MTGKLKQKAISGMMWNAVERFGSTFFLFLSNLVLARLLMPSDFGTVAMLMVFISISETIVDAGFGSALIQKKDVDEKDYSTVFIWNISFSILLYLLLLFLSPQIAKFYNNDDLCLILRVQGLILPLNSLVIVHIARLKRELKFKLTSKINLLSVVIGTIIGIIAAFGDWGVWSLVFKMLVTSFIQIILYYYRVKWKPSIYFSLERYLVMFRFSIWILLSRIVNTLFHNMMALLIGKNMSATTLGHYNQAKKLEDIPRSTMSSIVNNVTFPVFSKIQDDFQKFKTNAKLCIRSLSFISTPIMICAIAVSKPLILLLFTEKWLPVVEYFQLLCVGAIALTPLELNYEFLNSLGHSKFSFYIRIFQRIIGIVLMFFGIKYGIYGLLFAYILGQFLSFLIAGYTSGKIFRYGLFEQVKDMLPSIVMSCISLFVCYFESILLICDINSLQIIIRVVTFFAVYGLLTSLFCNEEIRIIKESIYRIRKIRSHGKT